MEFWEIREIIKDLNATKVKILEQYLRIPDSGFYAMRSEFERRLVSMEKQIETCLKYLNEIGNNGKNN